MKLTHIGISNFRSIGEDFVTIDLTKKINVLVGANNCGKSNVLLALRFLGSKTREPAFAEIDRHHRRADTHPSFKISLSPDDSTDQILKSFGMIEVIWDGIQRREIAISWSNLERLPEEQLHDIYPRIVNTRFTRRLSPAEHTEHTLKLAGVIANRPLGEFPPIQIIPQFREITPGDDYCASPDKTDTR